MPNILLVEDHVLMRMGLRMALNAEDTGCKVVAEVGTVKEAKQYYNRKPDIDLIILDILLPDGTGIDVLEHIRSLDSEVKVLVISSDTEERHIHQLINLGINGFIDKSSEIPVLLDAIHNIMNGFEYYGQDIAVIIKKILTINKSDDKIFTPREWDIVTLCTKGYSVKAIAEELNISTRTVETHKNNIFKKLGFNSTGELARYALSHGFVSL
ncbi:MAG: response regulator transcription factor [Bacteroidales bacterium]|nr:response regulator transcription factor [Bacteroidales bacterium]